MFTDVRLRGGGQAGPPAGLLWGYRTAATLRAWTIAKIDGQWTLKASIESIDPFQARQTPLLFTAPRTGGMWAWPVIDLQVGAHSLVAKLGPPEQ